MLPVSDLLLSNAGGESIIQTTLDFWKAGRDREEIELKDLETMLSLSVFNNKKSEYKLKENLFVMLYTLDHYHSETRFDGETVDFRTAVKYLNLFLQVACGIQV